MSITHNSQSEAGRHIIFLASPMVTPRKGDRNSESAVRVARKRLIECDECKQVLPAPDFDGNGCCPSCWEEAGFENEHSDGYHEQARQAGCPLCSTNA